MGCSARPRLATCASLAKRARSAAPYALAGGIIVLVETHMTGTPVIGIWYQAMSDSTWPLSGFPFTSLSFEPIA